MENNRDMGTVSGEYLIKGVIKYILKNLMKT